MDYWEKEMTEQAETALIAIGERWRYNWSDFDGRTLLLQLKDWVKYERQEPSLANLDDYWRDFYEEWSICPQCFAPNSEWDNGCYCE